MTLEDRYQTAYRNLENFYSDTVKARSFDGTSSTKPGSKVLLSPPDCKAIMGEWRFLWRTAKGEAGREQIVRDMEAEWRQLGRNVNRRKYAYRADTREWKVAIANSDLSAKETANVFGVALSTVYKYRKDYGN